MANVSINVGSKLYNIYYGPMTVVGFYTFGTDNTKIICCTIDDYDNLSEEYKILYDMSPRMNYDKPDFNNGKYIKWLESSVGESVFASPKEASAVECDTPHGYFAGNVSKKTSAATVESAVGVKVEFSGESAVGLVKTSAYPGESGIGVKVK